MKDSMVAVGRSASQVVLSFFAAHSGFEAAKYAAVFF